MRNVDLVLFDSDGTLHNTLPVCWGATCKQFKEKGCEPPTFLEYHEYCHAPYTKFYGDRGVHYSSDEEIWKRFLELVNFNEALFFDDVIPVLTKCVSHELTLGLVTAARRQVIEVCYERHGLNPFFTASMMWDVCDKTPAIVECCAAQSISASRTMYVGDTVKDVSSALRAGVIPVGITRGLPMGEKLMNAGAKHVIDTLDEFLPLVSGGVVG